MTWSWRVLDAGRFRLDGGSMFGVVPKVLWEKKVTPDDRNRIPQACNCLLLERGNKRILVECGYGSGWDGDARDMFAMDGPTIGDRLAALDIDTNSIDLIILSHLHFDHAAGVRDLPDVPVALQRQEWEDACDNRSTMTRTYLPEVLDSIRDRITLLDGEAELMDNLRVMPLPGHTWGLHGIVFEDDEGTVCFPSDVLPTCNHVGLSWSMGYDMLPWDNMQTKKMLLDAAHSEGWRLVLFHEPDTPIVRVDMDNRGRYCLEPISDSSASQ